MTWDDMPAQDRLPSLIKCQAELWMKMQDLAGMPALQSSPHFKTIPGIGSLTTGRLPGGDLQHLGRQAHRPLYLEPLLLCSL